MHVHAGDVDTLLINNLLAGPGEASRGMPSAITRDVRVLDFPFVDREGFDYRLVDDPRVADAAVALPGGVPGPEREYQHEARDAARPVVGDGVDVGALERRSR